MSAGALGAAVGADKSVVSLWMSGKVRPSQHNLTRIAATLAQTFPGLSVLSFESPSEDFVAALRTGGAGTAGSAGAQDLRMPSGLLDAARAETGRRGSVYFGIYWMHYPAFSQPGSLARMALILRPEAGLIEARFGSRGFGFRGWAFLVMNRLQMVLAEERLEALAFLTTNAGNQPRASFITGVLSGPAEGLLVPTAAPMVLLRDRDLTGDAAADLAAYEAMRDCDPVTPPDDLPTAVRAVLDEAAMRPGPLLQVPFRRNHET
jgi:hypothetical protein